MDLDSSVTKIPLVGTAYQRRLEKLNIYSVGDLLFHIPSRYEDYRKISKISELMFGDTTTVQGEVESIKNTFTKRGKNFQTAVISDDSGSIQTIWFNQKYLTKNIEQGRKVSISGKVGEFSNKLAFISPSYEVMRGNKTVHTAKLVPVYPETAGISSKWLRSRINYILEHIDIIDPLPTKFIHKHDLIHLKQAFHKIHKPENDKDIEVARKRLAFTELLDMQIQTAERKKEWNSHIPTHHIDITKKTKKEFYDMLPFKLTDSQQKSIKEIFQDMQNKVPMNRLLEGDVGSGKTVVAAAGVYAAVSNGYQTMLMAPTQILAEQHYKSFMDLFQGTEVDVQLVVSGVKEINEKADLFVGTHALIHDKVNMSEVALVIIDEQHRFGVEQREHLVVKGKNHHKAPHCLTMTATPIPRTVALTFYGDLDLSTLDELPKGRKPIKTWVVPSKKREDAYEWIKEQINEENIQVFVVCPLIEESEHESMQQVKAATVEHEKLVNIFDEYNVGLLHGKQKNDDKSKTLSDFKKHKIDILVSTPVVEVGIDIPNATIMVIEGADRFGLAQLHQLRGRVGRGKKRSYCLLFSESKSKKTLRRLNALSRMRSGFELAELDLEIRGPGEILGIKQHGFLELKAANWRDKELLRATRETAAELIKDINKYKDFFELRYGKYKVLN